ncbi:SLIT-ROBO Rho GTPase-activating protein 1 isoform X2 [Lepeophtheirus salmonis]|uniref:SLIT-ROBO Rho GTPase-activating protein 1 isoform X2 n=1 Tax=Lepeophtheirus salmonis TaxID=72036 RepID=UPI001AE50CCD|nr:SLIT-ROBO Rho GTPase-activating protein 1-like isoform X2 [Lepeophtheirus salmonis]
MIQQVSGSLSKMESSSSLTASTLSVTSASDLKKLEKELSHQTGSKVKDIRFQLADQFKSLDGRLEIQQSIVSEVQDIFRRRAEIESNYSRDLDKLAKSITNRHKEYKQKRDTWQLFSSTQLWEVLIQQTKRNSKDHASLSEIYANHVATRCQEINEDLQRIYRKCREIGSEIHEEVLKVLHELHTAMKTHHSYQSDYRLAENKYQVAEKQWLKLQNSIPEEKRQKNRKYKLIDKEFQKRKQKYEDAKVVASKAQTEYLLCMESANSSVQKYFVDDLSDLIDCMDFGFHQSLNRAVMMHSSGLEQKRRSLQNEIDSLNKSLSVLDSRLDKQRYFESKNATFMIPKKFEFNPSSKDKNLLDDLRARKSRIKERLTSVKTESEEIWKSMETAEKTLSDMVSCNDYDTTRFFVEEDKSNCRDSESVVSKIKSDRQEIENFYMGKFREYVLNSNRVARLQAKYDNICKTLGDESTHPTEGILTLTRRPNSARRRRIGKTPRQGQPKLFGGSLEEFLEESNEDIPLIIRSCVRVINIYGLHHHGIFRVSGSQVEINNFRDAFERGDDPLADMTDASDINSVCGVLKLYLRELREPIFPIQYFDQFIELAQMESKHEFVSKVRELVKTWPTSVFIVMRYLFAFLNHLSEYSDENLMDPFNLAVCFGPTLVPIPEERDQVQYQNLVNELIKNFIIFHEHIFSSDVPGMRYEKYPSREPEDMGDSPNMVIDSGETVEDDSVFTEDVERDDFPDLSLDLFGKSSETLEAQALYEFKARSAREVNFHKGDTVLLYKQVSNDWWRGSVNGTEGLIPDKYITLRIRGEDDRSGLEELSRNRSSSSTSEGHSPIQASSSAAALLSNSARSTSRSQSSNTSNEISVTVTPSTSPLTSTKTASSSTTVVTLTSNDEDLTIPDPLLTHVIRVSGDSNSNNSEISSTEGHPSSHSSRSSSSPPAPLRRLELTNSSQDSLTSSGSNQELEKQLNNTLAEVEAITDDIVKKSASGARPRIYNDLNQSENGASGGNGGSGNPLPIINNSNTTSGVLLRQSSWASSRRNETSPDTQQIPSQSHDGGQNSFTANRRLWERLTSAQPHLLEHDEQKKKKQTPDLVMDLPVNKASAIASSSSSPRSKIRSTSTTTSTTTNAAVPVRRATTQQELSRKVNNNSNSSLHHRESSNRT